MLRPKQLAVLLVIFIFFSCSNSGKYPYAIKDFRKKLQPYLIKVVERGIVMGSDSALRHMATDAELERLGRSEHPILRATAFREMLHRTSFNHFDILMAHLDDTALVFTDAGEFGIWDRKVSDDILQEAAWKTKEAKAKTVDRVLTKHNYLRSAYLILENLEPQQKYYPFIKNMATRQRHVDPYGDDEVPFADLEYALYGLAKFKRQADIDIIKQRLMANIWKLSRTSFRLLKEYPDPAYFDVLQTYHHRQFYKFSGKRPGGFSGFPSDRAAPEDFIQALVAQQNEKSASLLDTMLTCLPRYTSLPDKESIINVLIEEVWDHPCPAYAALRERIKPKAEELSKWRLSIPIERHEEPIDTTKENYRWYP